MRLSLLLWASLVLLAIALLCLAWPRLVPGVRTRPRAALLSGCALAAAALAVAWPAGTREASGTTRLDALLPEWQFDERHQIHVDAAPRKVDAAIRSVTADEIFLFRTLTSIRRLGRRGPESILNAPGSRPLLEVATRSGFRVLSDEPEKELVFGTCIGPATNALMSFRLVPSGGGVDLVTETRVAAATPRARRAFAVYWRVILPGSDLIRRGWLRAIKRRAERPGAARAAA